MPGCPDRKELDEIFPPERTDLFFDALYGGAEEGAYDIRLVCRDVEENEANLAFQLVRREGHCLKCSITYGLPEVFLRHPVIDLWGVAAAVAARLGWSGDISWSLGKVMDINEDLQMIPFRIERKGA